MLVQSAVSLSCDARLSIKSSAATACRELRSCFLRQLNTPFCLLQQAPDYVVNRAICHFSKRTMLLPAINVNPILKQVQDRNQHASLFLTKKSGKAQNKNQHAFLFSLPTNQAQNTSQHASSSLSLSTNHGFFSVLGAFPEV